MDTYYWETNEEHANNSVTMSEYLEMQEGFTYQQCLDVDYVNGTYAEGLDCKGNRWGIHASGNGDFFNHKIEFELLSKVNSSDNQYY